MKRVIRIIAAIVILGFCIIIGICIYSRYRENELDSNISETDDTADIPMNSETGEEAHIADTSATPEMEETLGDIDTSEGTGAASATDSPGSDLEANSPNANIVTAKNALLYDCENDEILFQKNITTQVSSASILKLLTAITVLEYVGEEESVIVGEEINFISEDSSVAWLQQGQKLTIRMLLEGLLLPSGNDAAYVLATYVGRQYSKDSSLSADTAVQVFVELMNNKAKSIGMNDSVFGNPDGYDMEGQYTTTYDLLLLAKAAFVNATLREILSLVSSRQIFLTGEDITYHTSNELIIPDSAYYMDNFIGGKTGTSNLAGYCIAGMGIINGKECISIVMNSTIEGRWLDTKILFNLYQ